MTQTSNPQIRLRRLVRWSLFCSLIACFTCQIFSNTEETQVKTVYFDVPEGKATSTLKEAARQADVDIVFAGRLMRKVNTLAVQGEYVPLEVFDLMLSGASLAVFQHEKSGVYTIRKVEVADSATGDLNPENTTPMNEKKKTIADLFKGLLALAVASSPNLPAQDDAEEVFELSPFQVDGSKDVGYVATSTLAGTRIRTDLKDLGSAISVYTSEFLEDTGATDVGTLLSYTSNAEVGGAQGNFAGQFNTDDNRVFQTGARVNPHQNQRIRGLGKADLTRDYFRTSIPFDSFNTERVTVSRGPNALLFGIGEPAGVINYGLKHAVVNDTFGEVGVRFDNYGTHRVTLDYNKVLIDERLALRVSMLDQTKKFKQEPTFEDATRFYADLDFVISKNENSNFLGTTNLSMNGEIGEMEALPYESVPPTMAFHGWFESIDPGISAYTGSVPRDNVVAPADGGTWEKHFTYNPFVASRDGDFRTNTRLSHFRLINQVYDRWDGTGRQLSDDIPIGGYQGLILLNSSDTYSSAGLAPNGVLPPGVLAAGVTDPDSPMLDRWAEYHANSPYSESYSGGVFTVPTLQNTDVFDYRNMIYSGNTDRVFRDFDAYNVSLEQGFFDNKMGIELAYDTQTYETFEDFYFTGGSGTSRTGPYDIYVTIAEYLPNGQPNPNLGRAHTRVSNPNVDTVKNERKAYRATAFGEVDFTGRDGLFKNLGLHRFTALYNETQSEGFSQREEDQLVGVDFDIRYPVDGLTIDHFRRGTYGRVYVSDDLRQVDSIDDVRLNQINFSRPLPGDEYRVWYANTSGADPNGAERVLREGTVRIERILDGQFRGRTEVESKALSWQSYLFDRHIVGLYGIRKDTETNWSQQNQDERGFENRFADGRWNPAFSRLRTEPDGSEEGDTTTFSLVARYPESRLGELPLGMDLQVSYAESDNFNPVGLRSDALGRAVANPTGSTKEYGFLASFADGKYSLRANWFETALENITANLSVDIGATSYNRISSFRDAELQGIAWADVLAHTGLDASFPIQGFEELYQLEEANVPAEVATVFNPRREDTDNDSVWDRMEWDRPAGGISSFQSQTAEGVEFEFVANPTDNWRIIANVSRQETVQDETAPIMGAVIGEYNEAMQADRIGELTSSPDLTVDPRTINSLWFPGAIQSLLEARASDGTVSAEQREWRYTFVNTYEFDEGVFDGFSIGGAARWETEAATGYVYEYDTDAQAPIPDLSRPFLDDGLFSGDMWLAYNRKILEDQIDWTLQLNVRNLIGENDDIIVRTNPDGRAAVIRTPNPRTITLSSRFSF